MDPRLTLPLLISVSSTNSSREVAEELPPQEPTMGMLHLDGLETKVPRGHTDLLQAVGEVERVFILGGSM